LVVAIIIFYDLVKLIGMEVVHDDCKTVVMAILDEVCPSREDIFVSCDPDQTNKEIELFFNAAQNNLTL